MRDRIWEMVAEFDAACEAKGHAWAKNPLKEGTEYCQACGKTRAILSAFGITGET